MKRFFFLLSLLALVTTSNSWSMEPSQSTEVQATYKDIKQTLGIVPTFLKDYPEAGISGAWQEMKGLQLNPKSVLPGKYKELIGLAIAAQIPCRFCVYFHTESAKLNKATNLETKEAIAMAAQVRRWSTFLTGVQIDVGEFRSEVDKMLIFQNNQSNLQAMEVKPALAEVPLNTPEAVYKEIKAYMGFVPNYITQYPKSAIVGAWKEMKGVELNPDSAISGKYKELIGLAVSSQIPCQYCVYYHTQAALMQGATKEELEETAALAGTVRTWSTVLNGQLTDEKKFQAEVNQIMKYLGSSMKKEVGLLN